MIVVFRIEAPGIIFAYHTNAQEMTVKEAYPASDFAAFKAPTVSIAVGDEFDTEGLVEVELQ